jgi:hypothetical protein
MAPTKKKETVKRKKNHVCSVESGPRRPRTYCRVIEQRKSHQIKTYMQFNELGEAISSEYCLWSSWVGKTARTRVKITYNCWHDVPDQDKEDLWIECKVTLYSTNKIGL